ncbi:MAG: hypothetical protein ACR2N1_04710 [Rubripirellula sp.]
MSKPDAIPWYASFSDAASLAKGVSFQAHRGVVFFVTEIALGHAEW